MFGFGFYDVFIIAGILGIQYFLSTRNSVYWGGLIPLVFIVWRTWILWNENENFLHFTLILLLGLAFLLAGWYEGRKALHKKRKQELDKMRSFDMQ